MKDSKRLKNVSTEVGLASTMFTTRLRLGYVSVALLAIGLPTVFGGLAAPVIGYGLNAYLDGMYIGLAATLLIIAVTAFALRGGRRPLILKPIGNFLLAGFMAAVIGFVIVRLVPTVVRDPSLVIMATLAGLFLLFLSPFAFFVWRMVHDPALRE